MKQQSIRAEYVEYIPKKLENSVLYISKKFRTASHLCCCGCGTKIVTPLRSTEYSLINRGTSVSLYPSIGNWNYPCQSHYWINNNKIIWANQFSKEEIRLGRAHDDALKESYFNNSNSSWYQIINRLIQWLSK